MTENNNGKHVVVTVPGAGERSQREAMVLPGTTAGDLLQQLDLGGYWLKKPREDTFFASDENVYAGVQDGDKLEASSPATVGRPEHG